MRSVRQYDAAVIAASQLLSESGTVLSNFSTHSDDSGDIFIDPSVDRFSLL